MEKELEVATLAARRAGEMLRNWTGALEETWKGPINPVTAADRESERILIAALREAFPDDAIVAEESSAGAGDDAAGRRRWYVDPLDGTVNFSRGIPHWCVSVALADEEGVTRCAVVYAPLSGELFTAVRGGGASLNGKPIRVRDTRTLDRAVAASGFPYSFEDPDRNNLREWTAAAPRLLSIRCLGAAALDLCQVACGRLDVFWEKELERWDLAAGALICAEAGAVVTDLEGRPLAGPGTSVLAANPHLHPQVLALLRGRG